jgi:hypothetical protein
MTALHLSHKKMKNVNSKKCESNVKKIKNHQIKFLLVKCIETFLIYIFFQILKVLNDVIVVNFYP